MLTIYMKKLLLFLFLPLLCLSQNIEFCDSISVTFSEYNTIDNTIEIDVISNYSSQYSFPYAGFILKSTEGDTIAIETLQSGVNVYGLNGGMSETRVLEVVGDFMPPGNGTIHLANYLFAGNSAIICSWPFDYINGYTYIPDNNFEQKLIDLGYDDTINNYVLTSNIVNISYLDLSYLPISSLTGIEDFSQLEFLNCSGALLSELNITNNTELSILECNQNNLSELNITNNPNLTNLACAQNNLSELNTTNNPNLTYLNCSNNNLVDLDISSNLQLEYLSCEFNNLINLDLSNNASVNYLFCQNNNLSELNLTTNIDLEYVSCQNNNFFCAEIWDPSYAEENEDFLIDDDAFWSVNCDYENQTPFQGLVISEVENNNLVEGNTYRVYAKINEGKLNGYWANENNNSYIQTSTSFYIDQANLWDNLPDEIENKKIQRGINPEVFDAIPSSRYTSWLTLGDSYNTGTVDCPYNAVFHKSENFELGVNNDESAYLLNYIGGPGESGFVRLAETDYGFINNNLLYYSTPQSIGWFPYGGNPNGLIQGEYCPSDVTNPDENNLVLLFQMTTNGSICGLINLEGTDENGNIWAESGIDFLIENENILDCNGNCIIDLDNDLVCDQIDECVGEYDECGICNGNGPELYYDCNWNCLNDTDGDGWCDEIEIEGCDDINSCNYNPISTDIMCIYPADYYDCDDNCINDLDQDFICDEIDDCIGEYDECNTCNGFGPEVGYDCNGNCVDNYTQLTLIWTGGLNATFSVTGDINGLLYTQNLSTDTGYLTECWLTDLQADCFTINIEGGDSLEWELYSGNLLIIEGNSDNIFFGSQCETGCMDPVSCVGYNPFALIDNGSCEYPGDECILPASLGPDFEYGIFNENCECVINNTSIRNNILSPKNLITIVNGLGQEITKMSPGQNLLYIFDDGSIEKKHIIR